MEHADLDIRLIRIEQRGCEVQQREVVLAREVLDLLRYGREAAVERMLRPWEVLEEPRELLQEAIRVHR